MMSFAVRSVSAPLPPLPTSMRTLRSFGAMSSKTPLSEPLSPTRHALAAS